MNEKTLQLNLWGIVIASILTFGSITIAIVGWKVPVPTTVEMVAVWTSYVCTFLCVMQSRTNYYWGFISVLLYAYLFYSGSLYASAVTQLYLSGALLYGWWRWGPDTATRRVRFTPVSLYIVYFVVTVIVWGGAMTISETLGGAVPKWDALILALTILAQFLLDNKRIETWIVWVAVNLVSIWLYWQAGFILVVVQYVFFLANTMWGYYEWRRSMLVRDVADVFIDAADSVYELEQNRRKDLAP
jgi:nicotinamide mononucleotide transporter